MTRNTFSVLLICFALPIQAEEVTGKVIGITDGDTLMLLINKQQVKIGFAEIDTPEKGQPWVKKAKKVTEP